MRLLFFSLVIASTLQSATAASHAQFSNFDHTGLSGRATIACSTTAQCISAGYKLPLNSHYACNRARRTCTFCSSLPLLIDPLFDRTDSSLSPSLRFRLRAQCERYWLHQLESGQACCLHSNLCSDGGVHQQHSRQLASTLLAEEVHLQCVLLGLRLEIVAIDLTLLL
jgi:hypothetical protein